MKRNLLLNNWLYKVLSDNPEIISPENGVVGIYSILQDEFLKDARLSIKAIAQEVLLKVKPK